VWDAADETTRDRVGNLTSSRLPRRAAERYDEFHPRLAAEIPEFAIWSGSLEIRATMHSLRRLEGLLLKASAGRDPSRHRAVLGAEVELQERHHEDPVDVPVGVRGVRRRPDRSLARSAEVNVETAWQVS
jgi:hypothetical protein